MRARVPHGLLTHVELNPLPVLRGELAKAVYRRMLDMELRPFYAGPVVRPDPGRALWLIARVPSGGQQWTVLQPDEWLAELKDWTERVADYIERRTRYRDGGS